MAGAEGQHTAPPTIETFQALFSPEGAVDVFDNAVALVKEALADEAETAERMASSDLYSSLTDTTDQGDLPLGERHYHNPANKEKVERVLGTVGLLTSIFPGKPWLDTILQAAESADSEAAPGE
jgi:hypothetical protein